MILKILRRYLRQPLPGFAVVMLGAILAVVLCHLEQSHQAELESFEKTYASVPVHFEITDFDGGELTSHKGIDGWVVDLFYPGSALTPDLCRFTTDRQLRMEYTAILGALPEIKNGPMNLKRVIGITSTRVARELTPEYGGEISWYDGFDESVFQTEDLVLIVPADYDGEEELLLTFQYTDKQEREYTFSETFIVAGRHSDQGNRDFYCPYQVMDEIYRQIKAKRVIQCFGATLTDNSLLEEFRETADHWFARPNPMGEPTYWGKYGYEKYLYALEIRDDLLKTLEENLKTSMSVNRLASLAVLIMSAATGCLTGFLMIRSRKPEIGLMRSLGCSGTGVYFEFALEQMLCISAGSLGAVVFYQWQMMEKAILIIGFYFAGLSLALLIFMRNNLLTNLKEEE